MTAIAAERFRIRHGRWPRTLEELTPDLLAQVPADPFSQTALQIVSRDDGLIIHSALKLGVGSGVDIDNRVLGTPGRYIGFSLWNPDKRRQPPPKAEEKNP